MARTHQILFPGVSLAFLTGLLYFWLLPVPMTTAGTSPRLAPVTHFCGLSLSFSTASCSSMLVTLFLPPPPFLVTVAPASNLRLPLTLSLSRQAHFLLHTTYRSISPLSDSASLRHFPSLRASSSFCCLPASKPLSPYLSLLPAFPPLSTSQTLPLLALHFNLILNKAQIHSEKGSARLPPPGFVLFLTRSTGHFLPFCSGYLNSSTAAGQAAGCILFGWIKPPPPLHRSAGLCSHTKVPMNMWRLHVAFLEGFFSTPLQAL